MAEAELVSRVLIVGATGYIGKRIAQASLDLGHPTFLLIRPDIAADLNKIEHVMSFKRRGARLMEGSMSDHSSLVTALKQVDVVISAMAGEGLVDQLKLIEAITEAGNIKRFLPSEFGMDPDRMEHSPPPAGDIFVVKRRVRRAIEAAGIPYTYVSANCFAAVFLAGLGQMGCFMPPKDRISIYGDGSTKVVFVAEEDVGTYVIKTIDDPRTENITIYLRPPENVLSQNEIVSIWEKHSGKVLEKVSLPEEEWLRKMEDNSYSDFMKMVIGHLHHIFYEGVLHNFEIGPTGAEASKLYPEVKYVRAEAYLQRFV